MHFGAAVMNLLASVLPEVGVAGLPLDHLPVVGRQPELAAADLDGHGPVDLVADLAALERLTVCGRDLVGHTSDDRRLRAGGASRRTEGGSYRPVHLGRHLTATSIWLVLLPGFVLAGIGLGITSTASGLNSVLLAAAAFAAFGAIVGFAFGPDPTK